MLNLPLKVEVPDTPAKFKLGLMFRESLDRDSGMLFIFEEVGYQSFHMNHTSIPLDIAFINESGIIESIKELKPYNPIPVSSEGKILYALEVNKGWFEENNVKVGDQVMEDTIKVEDANGNLAFEVVDLIKPDPMKGVSSEEVKLPEIKKDTKFIDGIRKGVLPFEKSKISSKVKSLPGS